MAYPFIEWPKVLIHPVHPLGLTGCILFLLFGLLARAKRPDERRWLFLSPVVMTFINIVLLGGLGLSYLQMRSVSATTLSALKPNTSPSQGQQQNSQVQQISTGSGSPNIQGVQGDVTVTVNQSSGEDEPQTSLGKKVKKGGKRQE